MCIYTVNITFVWDEKKNRENIRKHGIDFRDVDHFRAKGDAV